ncbi:segregation/condensation protein A [Ornithinibacillus sp. L9]|uniref:Segregation and condensation protein A n=1 Tax=Ornithinibacillus caprae TaxID=2678566 RepID=A0A6N8FGN8_9BACI|nr:segregation/condensation protein A [Ornithinibacillus caprae]MUK87227.1 segregation/condensation protein A [Ornithinibacillus caprae]
MNQAYKVKLDTFEGPLDLLLHLINRYEIDIYDIPVAQITEQYMEYIHTMQRLELNIASEYLVMAATLLAIKSQMLLPKQEITDESDEYEEDPREELMQRLIEYRKYKQAAEQLKEKEVDSNQIFTRAPLSFDTEEFSKAPVIEQGDISIYDMLGALGKMLERKKWKAPLETSVQRSGVPIEQRMVEILHLVKVARDGIYFDDMFTHKTRSHIVVTFIALLELMKKNEVTCKQKNHFDSLFVYYVGD